MNHSTSDRDLVEQLRAELRTLRAQVARLESANPERPEPSTEQELVQSSDAKIGRRALLGKFGAVTAGGVGLVLAGAGPASAGTDGDLVLGSAINDSGSLLTLLTSTTNGYTLGIENTGAGDGLYGIAQTGSGVLGESVSGVGVLANSSLSNGVEGRALDSTNGYNGVYGHTVGTGNGVFGEQKNTSNTGNAVLGINHGSGNSIFGYKPGGVAGDAVVGVADTGRGLFGVGGAKGRGGEFTGGKAQIRLTPSTASSHPTSGQAGDLFCDQSKRLWFCKGRTTWVQLA